VENQNSLFLRVATNGWFRLLHAEQKFFHASSGVDVDGAGNMSTIVLIVKAAVDNVETRDAGIVDTVEKVI
jgi:hypothetical protein